MIERINEADAVEAALRHLTPREREIVEVLAQGVTRWRAIAERLCLSEHTVHFHIGNILLKLGLETSAQIVGYAYMHGLVTPEAAGSRLATE